MAAGIDVGDGSYSVEEEIELLEAIYIHELTVEGPRERPTAVSILLHPSTGDEESKRFVCLTLLISLPEQYPSELPSIQIKTPRGLSEAHISSILSNLRELAESCVGRPMLYELIEYAKESLTDNNVPSCTCAICLCHFQDTHEFTKTECYHYFHCGCLARYIGFSLQQENANEDKTKVDCPMCRLPITYNLAELQTVASETNEDEFVYEPSEEIKKLQRKMASLFQKQKRKGGVIDVEQERNKFLIDITTVRQEESKPERDPTGLETDTVKANPVAETQTINAPKRSDITKEIKEQIGSVRSEKPERKEKKGFTKNSRPCRDPRRPGCEPTIRSWANTVKANPFNETPGSNLRKRPDVAKEIKKRNIPAGSDKPERGDSKEFTKTSRSSRGPVHPFEKTGDKPEEGRFEKRRTEKKDLSEDDGRKTSEKKVVEKFDLNESDEYKNGFTLYVDAKQVKDQADVGAPDVRVTEKVARDDCGARNDGNSKPNSNGERPRSAKRRRGKSGRGRRSDERKSDFQDGGNDSNKTATSTLQVRSPDGAKPSRRKSSTGEFNRNGAISSGVSVKTTSEAQSEEGAKTSYKKNGGDFSSSNTTSTENFVKQALNAQPLEGVKPFLQKNGYTHDQATSVKEIPSGKGTSTRNKGKACMPPPGFESIVIGKGGSGQSTSDLQPPPPGLEKRPSQSRLPPGLSEPIEQTESSVSPSIPR